MTAVAGLDLSLTGTGMASSDDNWSARIVTKPIKDEDPVAGGLRRIGRILREMDGAGIFDHDLIVVEGPSFGQGRQQGEHDRAGLWWMVVEQVVARGVPLMVATPATIKTYTTGKGSASKDAVLAAVVKRYLAWDVTGNDIADAVGAMAIGARMLGEPVEESLPQTHLRALGVLKLPGGVG